MQKLARSVALALIVAAFGAAAHSAYSEFGVQSAGGAAAPKLALLKTMPTGSTGRWDYLTVDAAARRLYVPRSTHVQVIDADKGDVLGDIPGTNGVHGVALAPEQNLGFASAGKDNAVTVFDLKTLQVTHTIKVGVKPDAILFDPASKHVLVMCHGDGQVMVIDPAALDKPPVSIAVGGTLEFAVADGAGRAYVNVEDKNELVALDTKTNQILARWPLAPGEGPTGLALDGAHHRLFSGCGENNKMIVLDSDSGKILARVEIGKGVDGVAFDDAAGIALSANGKDGTITIVQETSPGTFAAVQTVPSLVGARTIALDPATHHAVLPCNVPDGKGGQTFGIAVVGVAPAQ